MQLHDYRKEKVLANNLLPHLAELMANQFYVHFLRLSTHYLAKIIQYLPESRWSRVVDPRLPSEPSSFNFWLELATTSNQISRQRNQVRKLRLHCDKYM